MPVIIRMKLTCCVPLSTFNEYKISPNSETSVPVFYLIFVEIQRFSTTSYRETRSLPVFSDDATARQAKSVGKTSICRWEHLELPLNDNSSYTVVYNILSKYQKLRCLGVNGIAKTESCLSDRNSELKFELLRAKSNWILLKTGFRKLKTEN